jgi:hypothetical protein
VLIFDAALDGRVELVTSPLLLREVTMVLARPRLFGGPRTQMVCRSGANGRKPHRLHVSSVSELPPDLVAALEL